MSELSEIDKQLCYNFVFSNDIAYHDFFAPADMGEFAKIRFYQYPYMLANDAVIRGGRRYGKSYGARYKASRRMFVTPGQTESLVTSYRKEHCAEFFDKIVHLLEINHYLRKLLKTHEIRGSVFRDQGAFSLELESGHILYSIAAGDNKQAPMIKGKKPRYKWGEEFQDYPKKAFQFLESTVDPKECHEFYWGVADGRRDTPWFGLNEKNAQFSRKKYAISRRNDPNFKLVDLLKLRDSLDDDTFKCEVDAEHGSVKSGVWNMDELESCTSDDEDDPMREIIITPDILAVIGGVELYFQNELKMPEGERQDCGIGIDVGDVESTEILIYFKIDNVWELPNIIALKNRIAVPEAKKIISVLFKMFNPNFIGIDITNSPGLADELIAMNPQFMDCIYKVHFSNKIIYGQQYVADDEEAIRLSKQLGKTVKRGEYVELSEKAKKFSTRLFSNMIQKRQVWFYSNPDIYSEFSSETSAQMGETYKILTPRDVHIPEACRCFALANWFHYGETLDVLNEQRVTADHIVPVAINTGICGHKSVNIVELPENHPYKDDIIGLTNTQNGVNFMAMMGNLNGRK